jgi:transcriptional regulator with XRE-family HTH domain
MDNKDNELTISFGGLLRYHREKQHLKQYELAKKAGLSPGYLAFLESERRTPSREITLRIASSLELKNTERKKFIEAAGYSDILKAEELTKQDLKEPLLDSIMNFLKAEPGAEHTEELLHTILVQLLGASARKRLPKTARADINALGLGALGYFHTAKKLQDRKSRTRDLDMLNKELGEKIIELIRVFGEKHLSPSSRKKLIEDVIDYAKMRTQKLRHSSD